MTLKTVDENDFTERDQLFQDIKLVIRRIPDSFSTSEINDLFMMIDKESPADHKFLKKCLKESLGITAKEYDQFWTKYNNKIILSPFNPAKWHFQSEINNSTTSHLIGSSCYLEKTTKKGEVYYEILYKWELFKILGRYQDIINEDEELEWRYDINLNGNDIFNLSFGDMKETLKMNCYQSSRGASYITDVLQQYCKTIPIIEIEKYCGFMPKGWRLPPDYRFRPREDNIKKNIKQVQKMMKLECDEEKAIGYFQEIYDMTKISNKGIIFSFFLIAPFLHTYKQLYPTMPQLAFGGTNDTGKSIMTQIGCEKLYNITMESANSIKSASRLMGALSGSTFPVGIDDAERFSRNLSDIMKSHATMNNPFKRKKGQKLDIFTIMLGSVILNFNLLPAYFKDPANRDRLIYIEPEIDAKDLDPLYKVKLNRIPDGYIGRYIIDQTKDWTMETIRELCESFDVNRFDGSRSKNSARCVMLGKYLINQLFKIEVDLSDLEGILEISKSIGLDQLTESIKYMAIQGLELDSLGRFRANSWIRDETLCKYYKKENLYGILIDITRKTEILKQYDNQEISKDTSMNIFYKMLSAKWKKCLYKTFKYNGVSKRYIFIPSEYIIERNISLKKWYNMTEEEKNLSYTEMELEGISKKLIEF